MTKNALLLFIYERDNKYGTHVLIGSLEHTGIDECFNILLLNLEKALEVMPRLADKYNVKILAYSILTTHLVERLETILKLTKLARKLNFITVAGGPHATGDPYGTILSLRFDYIIVGEGEKSFVEFLDRIINRDDVSMIKGVAYREQDKIIINGRGFIHNLSSYPAFSIKYGLFNPIEVTRGCPYACRYCQVSYMFSARLRHRDIDDILRHCNVLLKKGIKDIRFITPDALSYGSRGYDVNLSALTDLVEALQKIRAQGGRVFLGTFPSEVRPEHINEEVVRLLRNRIDNKRIIIGAQTGSDKLLKAIGRRHIVDDVINAIEILRKYDFNVDVDYIFGLPHEDEEDIELTIKHMERVASMGARIHAHVFMPLPGTPFSFAPPGKIGSKLRKSLYKLLGRGLVYGQWERQERIAEVIAKLRDKGIILITPQRAKSKLWNSKRS